MAITLKKLATTLGLHHSTVAYALSGKGTVKEATRQRVRDVAQQLGYVPNGLARRMRSKHTRIIGLVVPDVVLSYNELVQQLFRAALARDYDIQIALTEFSPELEDKAVRSLMESRVDGLILKSRHEDYAMFSEQHAVRQLTAQGVPTICYGWPMPGSDFGTFQLPIQAAAALLTRHLIQRGHRQFAWLLPAARKARPNQQRIDGTRGALADQGLNPDALQIFSGGDESHLPRLQANGSRVFFAPASELNASDDDENANPLGRILPRHRITAGRTMMARALAAHPRPTAILCPNEATAIGAILATEAAGLRVPQDIAIAAAARTVAADLAPISLTTAAPDIADAADSVLDTLLNWIDQPAAPPPLATVEPMLVIGQSTVAQ